MRRVLALAVVLATGQAAGGCGPIAYVQGVTYKADDAVAEAKAAEAEKYAPYYWTRANQYLYMAREVAAHADYQGANRFGRLAADAANKAVEEAGIVKADPSKGPIDPNKEIAPGKDDGKDGGKDGKGGKGGKEDGKSGKDKVAPAKEKPIAPAKDAP
jgi:hypothetical protein